MYSERAVAAERLDVLTAEQLEVLAALAGSPTDVVAARRLDVSPRTLRRRVATIERELGTRSRFQLGLAAAALLGDLAATGVGTVDGYYVAHHDAARSA